MFDSMKIERSLDKASFKALEPGLREGLLDLQSELIAQKRCTILILINGADGVGKGAILNQLYGWLDARKLATLTYEAPTDEERARPAVWKYWRDMPAHGEIGIILGSWYHTPLETHALGGPDGAELTQALDAINHFEAMLHAEGVLLLKLWLYLDPEDAKARLKALDEGPYDRPVVREWTRISSRKTRRRLEASAAEAFRQTSTGIAPWTIVPAADPHYCAIAVGNALMEVLIRATAVPPAECAVPAPASAPAHPPPSPAALQAVSILSTLDFSHKLDETSYRAQIDVEQQRITHLTNSRAFAKRGLVCAFEGSDAAGKSSTIMRLREALDPRHFRVHPISAPSDEERARPYLWRFWRRIPARGSTAVFDRSWYGRVLVERVEKLTPQEDWSRAYGEINDFERQLHEGGYVLAKFWLAISPDEQARRFAERERVAYKRFKLTPEDWRNREKWPLYEQAVTDMVDRTSTFYAPWTLVEAENKHFARVKVLRTIADRLEEALG